MERQILRKLARWKDSRHRKPLLLEGARRVGKTWVLKAFGERCYENTAYVSFTENEAYKAIFEPNREVDRIVAALAKTTGRAIEPGRTLIVFDDIGECPKALNALKYFCEDAPQYHVACTATPPTTAFSKPASFPVGKVDFMRLDPMTFTEFLRADGDADAADSLDAICTLEPIPEVLFGVLFEKLARYFMTGGMPEAVGLCTEHAAEHTAACDADPVRSVLAESAKAYERDFVVHGKAREFSRITEVWKSLPSQLARQNEAFSYGIVREGARARTYEAAVRWLVEARLVHRIPRSTGLGLPVAAYDGRSAFRLCPADVGFLYGLEHMSRSAQSSALSSASGDSGSEMVERKRLFAELNGSLTEAFVLQSLIAQFEVTPRYWAEGPSSGATIFLIQRENDIFPVEVRTEGKEVDEGRGGGLERLKAAFPDHIKLCVRFSTENLKLKGNVLTVPLFLADRTDRLIGLALDRMKEGRSV